MVEGEPGARPAGRRPEVWPTPARAAAAAALGRRCRGRRAYAANSGSTSPCSAQSSSVADSSVVRSRRAADRGVDVVGRRPRRPGARPASRRARRRRAASGRRRGRRGRRASAERRAAGGGEPGGRSGGPRHRMRRARRPQDLPSRSGHANIHESSDRRGCRPAQGPVAQLAASRGEPTGRRPGSATRSAHGTAAARRRDDADAAAGELDVQRVRAAVQTRTRSVGRRRAGRATRTRCAARRRTGSGITLPDASRAPLRFAAVRLCQRSARTSAKC